MKVKYVIVCLLFTLVQSCAVTRDRCSQLYPPVVTHSVDTLLLVKETLHHDTTYIATDNSEFEIILEADSDNMVQVVAANNQSGVRSAINYKIHRNKKSLQAVFNCKCDSLAIYHVFKSIDTTLKIDAMQTQIHQLNVPARLTWWQQFKIGYGGHSMLLILLYIALRVGWWALKTYAKIQLPFTGFL